MTYNELYDIIQPKLLAYLKRELDEQEAQINSDVYTDEIICAIQENEEDWAAEMLADLVIEAYCDGLTDGYADGVHDME